MEFQDGVMSAEHRELHRSAAESADPSSVSPLEIRSPRSPRTPRGRHSPATSPRSPRTPRGAKSSPGRGSPVKNGRHSQSGRDGRPKKGGSGGKGTWGEVLAKENEYYLDPNDPNYDTSEEASGSSQSKLASARFQEFKKKAAVIVEEYFTTGDIFSAASELADLGRPSYHHHFVKKLVSTAMDRHDREKEMAAALLSALYAEAVGPRQVRKGFRRLLESADDLSVDIPDAADVLALFVARAVVDEILPPAFLARQAAALPEVSKGAEAVRRAEKAYLSAPRHAETVLRKWGGGRGTTADEVRARIGVLLAEYAASGDEPEACRCVRELKVPFFHHEIVKRALVLAMEERSAEGPVLGLLKHASEEGVINASQMSKGFNRTIDAVDDLCLDVPAARGLLQSLISKAASEGWLCASSLSSLARFEPEEEEKKKKGAAVVGVLEEGAARAFKTRATSIIQEYFLTGSVPEVTGRLEAENAGSSSASASSRNAMFAKKLITMAMDRKNREKEMASALLASLGLPAEDVAAGFLLLIEAAEDAALDVPAAVEDLAMFLARAVVDEALAPSHLEELGSSCEEEEEEAGCCCEVVALARSLLRARLSGERILRCWGGGGGGGGSVDDVKEEIRKLLEEYESGGDVGEACRRIKELGMPFFHHEVVKKAVVGVMEKRSDRLWGLLEACHSTALVTASQMTEGFRRVAECMDDLVLDVPDAGRQFGSYVERAKRNGWLNPSFQADYTDRHGHGPGHVAAAEKGGFSS